MIKLYCYLVVAQLNAKKHRPRGSTGALRNDAKERQAGIGLTQVERPGAKETRVCFLGNRL